MIEGRMVIDKGLGEGRNGKLVFNGYTVLVWEDEVLKSDSGNGHTTMQMYLMPLNCILKNGYNGKFYDIYLLPQ